MALCDYRLCDRCGGKAFYDANLNYGDPGATRVRGQHYTLDYVGDWAVLCQTCAETHSVVIMSNESGTPRLEDGWRRCEVGQRTTEHCGMVEEARAQERERIVALIQEHIAYWQSGPEFRNWDGTADEFDEVIALKRLLRLLRQVEETSHE